ncbi:MAG: signal peptidase II [Saccharofermentans sp.]|nr:signal peptidase II [Saccharofermentans sp.]
MSNITKRMYAWYSILCIAMVVLDQVTKHYIVKTIILHRQKTIIKGFFSLYYTQNTGSAFSFLADKSWGIYVLSAISLVMAILILFLMLKAIKLELYLIAASMALLVSGAAGNLIDRFRLHYVVDFISFTFGSYNFAIFNVADIFAVCGTILLIAIIIFDSKKFDVLLDNIGPKKDKGEGTKVEATPAPEAEESTTDDKKEEENA